MGDQRRFDSALENLLKIENYNNNCNSRSSIIDLDANSKFQLACTFQSLCLITYLFSWAKDYENQQCAVVIVMR